MNNMAEIKKIAAAARQHGMTYGEYVRKMESPCCTPEKPRLPEWEKTQHPRRIIDYETFAELYNRGLPYKDIAWACKVSMRTITVRCRQWGINKRPRPKVTAAMLKERDDEYRR